MELTVHSLTDRGFLGCLEILSDLITGKLNFITVIIGPQKVLPKGSSTFQELEVGLHSHIQVGVAPSMQKYMKEYTLLPTVTIENICFNIPRGISFYTYFSLTNINALNKKASSLTFI